MLHPDTELRFISEEKGLGVVATKFIPKGTITWVQDKFDQVFTEKKIVEMSNIYTTIVDTYCFRNNKGDYVLCWDHARFINHSFFSNCLTTAYDFEIAIRDIFPGEELTDDYGYLNVDQPCAFSSEGSARNTVYSDDLLQYHKEWDQQIYDALLLTLSTEQKLWGFVSDNTKKELNDILIGKILPLSILSCYYDRKAPKTT